MGADGKPFHDRHCPDEIRQLVADNCVSSS
jgi:hypothetical protein